MSVIRKTSRAGRHIFEWFEDSESKLIYRRIKCGFAWPYSEKPGFICVLAEDFKQDYSLQFGPRHFRILAESEFLNFEALHRRCREIKEEYSLKKILGIDDTPLYEIWNRSKRPDEKIYLTRPYDFEKITLNLISQLVRRHTERGYKTLHFGDQSRLPSYLSALTSEEIEEKDFQAYPAIAAFGYCLCEMELRPPIKPPGGWKRRKRNAMVI
jgi:hypothetical protein